MATGKHVIFLGAGASKGSGYPLANDLRLLISSKQKWQAKLQKYLERHFPGGLPAGTALHGEGVTFWDKRASSLDLFRDGGFATLDEFCKLTGGSRFKREVDALRYHIRVALGLFNPEDKFQKSEYYLFVQSLFNRDLVSLRDDITVLTYNYDPYVEYLLYRALKYRWHVTGVIPVDSDVNNNVKYQNLLNSVTSGFYFYQNTDWLQENGFSVLQLHGSIGLASDFGTFFEDPVDTRFRALLQPTSTIPPTSPNHVPILFPWEVINENGVVEKTHFSNACDVTFHPLFGGVWERAKREVLAANKISFVGLSMHHFLEDGLNFLFKGKSGKTEIVVANPDNVIFEGPGSGTYWSDLPFSPANVLVQMLKRVAPSMNYVGITRRQRSDGDITLVKDFSNFIKTQMTPVQIVR